MLRRFAEKERIDARACVERFKNYWLAKAGKDAIKLDWRRTFVNWVLVEHERGHVPLLTIRPPPPPKFEAPSPEERERSRQLALVADRALGGDVVAQDELERILAPLSANCLNPDGSRLP